MPYEHLDACTETYKCFIHPERQHVIVVPNCVRNWECPAHTTREMLQRFAPLYLPEHVGMRYYSPTLYTLDVRTKNASERIRDRAERRDALTFNVGFKHRKCNIIVCNKPVSPHLTEVVTAMWVREVVAIAASTPPSRITGMDKWGIEKDESEWQPLSGKGDWTTTSRLVARARARARREKWSTKRLIEYVEDGLDEGVGFPSELYDSDGSHD